MATRTVTVPHKPTVVDSQAFSVAAPKLWTPVSQAFSVAAPKLWTLFIVSSQWLI